MIISILTILLVIALHLFPRRTRVKITSRLKKLLAKLRGLTKGRKSMYQISILTLFL